MKEKSTDLSKRYLAGLQKYLRERSPANLQTALGIGRDAVRLGLETLELARIHERAFLALNPSGGKKPLVNQAQIFFTEVISPVVAMHRAARAGKTPMSRLSGMLGNCNRELAAANRQLKRGILRREGMEHALAQSGKFHNKRLEESLELQRRLRQLTHRALLTQEEERKKISRELQDEIAQTLMGINVRLLSLKKESHSHNTGLKNEIASTQRLVVKSAQSVRVVATRLGKL